MAKVFRGWKNLQLGADTRQSIATHITTLTGIQAQRMGVLRRIMLLDLQILKSKACPLLTPLRLAISY
tara:strand:- start:520 stop:723 length:204 start_codon:yes stop_codon:yes gene_type:complete